MITSKAYSIHISVHLIHTQNYLDLTIVYVLNQTLLPSLIHSLFPRVKKKKKKKELKTLILKSRFLRLCVSTSISQLTKGMRSPTFFKPWILLNSPPLFGSRERSGKYETKFWIVHSSKKKKKKKSFEFYVSWCMAFAKFCCAWLRSLSYLLNYVFYWGTKRCRFLLYIAIAFCLV